MTDTKKREVLVETFEGSRKKVLNDRRFSLVNGHLAFEGVDVTEITKKYPTPVYVYSEKEIIRNIDEIKNAFSIHPNTKIFYASKACSVMQVLRAVKNTGICAEANSMFEVRKCLEIGFSGDQIVFNGVVKKPEDLEFAIANDLYLINVDSFYELEVINEIAERLGKVANVCVRIEPNVPSATHPGLVTAFHAKSGIDREDAEKMLRRIKEMPHVHARGLHMHVGDQVPEAEPFQKATRVMVEESMRLEKIFGQEFELINVGGGIPVPYRYDDGDPMEDYLYGGIDSDDFAKAIVEEVHKWRKDIQICIEPGRKVPSSACIMLTTVSCEKTKTNYDVEGNVQDLVEWKFVDAGYSVIGDSLHFGWYFHVLNASKMDQKHDEWVKIAGPLCDGGDYFHQGVDGEFYLLPPKTEVGDTVVFLDAGAYSIESQTVYNNRPRTAVLMITKEGNVELIRRQDTYEDMVGYDIY
ncbi:ornithine/lysine decarboxylase DokD [Rubeoparvulum massiliense]|uniref:diaminopimelate decarboxylase n=1 Tax=Rubeoparvulum massiliense TaxID=1631346 RepID=UPI00065E50A0|nr:diaminopimelate decarboxylase [Rubeoparvulum massiliense]